MLNYLLATFTESVQACSSGGIRQSPSIFYCEVCWLGPEAACSWLQASKRIPLVVSRYR